MVAAATVASTLDIATIAMRRRAPRVALGTAVVVVLAATALPAVYLFTGIGVLVCAYTVATLLPRRQAIMALAAGCAVHAAGGVASAALGGQLHLVATYWANAGGNPADLVLASIGSFAIPGLVGLYVQTTRAFAAELRVTAGGRTRLRARPPPRNGPASRASCTMSPRTTCRPSSSRRARPTGCSTAIPTRPVRCCGRSARRGAVR